MTKYEKISVLAKETARSIGENKESWMNYLDVASRLYKYPFEDQILIYAQRPDATACAPLEMWNEKMFCWVNRGAKGIALIDQESDYPRLRYVFDVSDVHKARRIGKSPFIWNIREEHEEGILAALERIYGTTNQDSSFEDRIYQISKRIADDYYEEIVDDLIDVSAGSYLEDLDGDTVSLRLRETLEQSVCYTVLKRCGFDMAEYALDGAYVVSKDFTEGRLNFEPMANLVQDNEDYDFNYDVLQNLNPALLKSYLDILFMDALVFNVDRHTQNYGLLRSRETGKILSMAPNFDNNMALISRGYASDLSNIANPLIGQFQELLREKNIQYPVPKLTKGTLEHIVNETMPDAEIRRDYVVQFVWQNYKRLRTM